MAEIWTRRDAKNAATATLETRIKHTTLATLALWAEEGGYLPKSKSELVRIAMELLIDRIIALKPQFEITNTEQAMEILESRGYHGLNRDKRGLRALQKQLAIESEKDLEWNQQWTGQGSVPEHLRRLGVLPAEEVLRLATENTRRQREGLEPLTPISREQEAQARVELTERLKEEALARAAGCATVEEYRVRKELEQRKISERKQTMQMQAETLEESVTRREREAKEQRELMHRQIEERRQQDEAEL
jgi:hypothetical protein